MFKELKSLLHAGSAAPAPKTVAAVPAATPGEPPVASAPESVVASTQEPVVVAKGSNEPTIVKYEPEPVAAASKGTQLFDSSNKLRGTLTPDGRFIAVDVEADLLAHLSEEDRRPIDWDGEEKRIDPPQRSPGRIQFLLQYETEQQTKDRIANDLHRAIVNRPREEFDPEKTKAAESLKKWLA